MKVKRFNEISENYTNNETLIEKFENSEITLFSEFLGDILNYSDHSTSCALHWDYEFDTSRNGVEGIIPTIISVDLNILVNTLDDQDVQDEQEIILNYNNENCTFIINDKEDVGDYEKQVLPYYPQDIEFEKDKKTGAVTVTINFV